MCHSLLGIWFFFFFTWGRFAWGFADAARSEGELFLEVFEQALFLNDTLLFGVMQSAELHCLILSGFHSCERCVLVIIAKHGRIKFLALSCRNSSLYIEVIVVGVVRLWRTWRLLFFVESSMGQVTENSCFPQNVIWVVIALLIFDEQIVLDEEIWLLQVSSNRSVEKSSTMILWARIDF